MPTCVIPTCRNYYNRNSRENGNIHFHTFPRNPAVRKLWVAVCERVRCPLFDADKSRVCSDHFLPSDYKRDMRNELLGLPTRCMLSPDAVPRLALSFTTVSPSVNDNRKRKSKKKTRKSIPVGDSREETVMMYSMQADELMMFETEPGITGLTVVATTESERMLKRENDHLAKENVDLKREVANLRAEKEASKESLTQLQRRYAYLKKLKDRQQERQKQRAKRVAAKLSSLRSQLISSSSQKEFQKKVGTLLRKTFTQGQINCILRGNKRVKWTVEDIQLALKLRKMMTRKTYVFLRKNMHLPLPALSTLRVWRTSELLDSYALPELTELITSVSSNESPFTAVTLAPARKAVTVADNTDVTATDILANSDISLLTAAPPLPSLSKTKSCNNSVSNIAPEIKGLAHLPDSTSSTMVMPVSSGQSSLVLLQVPSGGTIDESAAQQLIATCDKEQGDSYEQHSIIYSFIPISEATDAVLTASDSSDFTTAATSETQMLLLVDETQNIL